MRVFLVLLILAFSLPAAAQEKAVTKNPDKKAQKKAEKKKPEPKQEWGRFNSNAKKDMKAIEEKKKKAK